MTQKLQSSLRFLRKTQIVIITLAAAGMIIAGPAWAGKKEAEAALARADAKIEVVTRQVGQSGLQYDQSFTMSRERLSEARVALQKRRYDSAEMMADEASLMAELTVEKAKLNALQTSRDNMMKATTAVAPQ